MSLLFRVIFSTACSSTHHKLAMDALRHLRGNDAEGWRNLFLKNYETFLDGSKAPDNRFKDFKNHVLHVNDNFWGGAVAAAQAWYDKTVAALREKSWSDAIFAAGVLSHYYSDPLMPFHTAQSEEECKVHRAAEWSIACVYGELQNIIEKDLGYPQVEISAGADWLARMVRHGALISNQHYHVLIDHYDLARGVKNPPAGLDQECKDRVAGCLAHAIVGMARILERAFADAEVAPPPVTLSLETFLATLKIPVRWVAKKLADAQERALVEKIYAEVRQTGKVIENLPEDEKTVRNLHAQEVLKVPLAEVDAVMPRASGQAHGDGATPRHHSGRPSVAPMRPPQPSPVSRPRKLLVAETPIPLPPPEPTPLRLADTPEVKAARKPRKPKAPKPATGPRFYLEIESPIKDAPSIGAAMAKRFEAIGVHSVADLLAVDADAAAERLDNRRIDGAAIRDMQRQAVLVCRVPQLRGHDAQILVACNVTDPAALAEMTPEALIAQVEPFLATAAADRILRSGPKPDLSEVGDWIRWARDARALGAA